MTDPKPVAASKTIMSRTMLPSDANPYGNVHGGEIMKLIDACAGAAATRHARSRVVTARIDELSSSRRCTSAISSPRPHR